MTLQERLEGLVKQHKEVSEQAAQFNTTKMKIEGAIEITQIMIQEEEKAKEEKDKKKK
jgi:hypothetical protein